MKLNLILILSLLVPAFSFAMDQRAKDSIETTGDNNELLEAHLKDRQMKMMNPQYHAARITFPSNPLQALSTEEKKLPLEEQVWLAIEKNSSSDLQAVLGKGKSHLATIRDEYGRIPLHFAAVNFRSTLIPILVAAGAEVNGKNDWGATPLVKAVGCSWGQVKEQNDTVSTLLALGADPCEDALRIAKLYGSHRDFVPALEAKMKK